MKLFIQNKKLFFLAFALGLLCPVVRAQVDSFAGLELYKKISFSNLEGNPTGVFLDNPMGYSQLDLNLSQEKGDFHRSMEGSSIRDMGFNTEGVALINNHYLKGFFNYTNRSITDEGYNASLIDPYRGMPYGVVDLNHSDWKNQYYDMGVRWAYPEWFHKLSVGADLNYQAHSGAKQRDVRANVRSMMIEVKPGVTWSFDKHHHLGGYLDYYAIKEESNNSNVNGYVSQEYYEMNGLGNAVQGIGSGRTTNYTGDNFGAGLDYSWIHGASKWMFASSYHLKAEKAEESFSLPREVGAVRHAIWGNSLKYYTDSSDDFTHLLELKYISSQIKGIEYITQRDNSQTQSGWQTLYSGVRSKYKKQQIGADYTLIARAANDYKWLAELATNYLSAKDTYLVPYSQTEVNNWLTKATFKRNIHFSGVCAPRLLLSAEAVYNKNTSGEFEYGGQHAEYITVSEIQQVDADYLMSDYWGFNVVVNYSQKMKSQPTLSWYVNGYFNYKKTDKFEFNNRRKIGIVIGCIF